MLETARLVLRPLERTDAAEIARLISDWDVIRWLTRPPHPYALADAEDFIDRVAIEDSSSRQIRCAITHDGTFIGSAGIDHRERGMNLGYWLGKPFWGKGLMTEAARALVRHFFAVNLDPEIVSGHLQGNEASGRVLRKLGFEITGASTTHARPLGRDCASLDMTLSRGRFETLNS
jgi:RimJ/RimL family protein N-acetyltransferase